MISSNKSLTIAITLAAIASLVIAGVGTAAVRADINNPGQVRIDDSKVVINIGAGKDGAQGPKGDTGDTGPEGPPGPAGPAGVDGKDGKDGMNATATVLINSTNGQQTQCTVSPPSTVNCVEVGGNTTIPPVTCEPPAVLNTTSNTCETPIIPPVVCEPPAVLNATTNQCETPIVPPDNNTNSTG